MARGEDGPDSDIDLLVVLPDPRAADRPRLLGELIQVGSIAPPVDAIPTDEAELAEQGRLPGMLRVASARGAWSMSGPDPGAGWIVKAEADLAFAQALLADEDDLPRRAPASTPSRPAAPGL